MAQNPALGPELLDRESNEVYGHIHIFVNGRDAPCTDDGLDTTLAAKDRVDIFPAVDGG